jgi:hypothetical protein
MNDSISGQLTGLLRRLLLQIGPAGVTMTQLVAKTTPISSPGRAADAPAITRFPAIALSDSRGPP